MADITQLIQSGNLLFATLLLIGCLIFAYVFIFKQNWLFIWGGPKVKVKNKVGPFGYGRMRDNPAYAKFAKIVGIIMGLFGIVVFLLTLIYSII
ncbi:hypothetical protein CMI46_03055 [Candidatus Pacearchaeota archaeon]|nr:hypothetical protein [Candidatus Pacearchaeota archaeon]|tara:strand:+ start:5151 stop:5432 length:282 start_codon:yes stop_codon:yes gene_type:complete